MEVIDTVESLQGFLSQPRWMVFKHSTRCPISAYAKEEVEKLIQDLSGKIPMAMVLVLEHREVSQAIEKATGIRHESPQVILKMGEGQYKVFNHFDIEANKVKEGLDHGT